MGKKLIAAGHICIDITPVFPAGRICGSVGEVLEPGKLLQMEAADVHTGGSVANTGLALKLLGADVRLLGKIGADAFGQMVQGILANYGAEGLIVDEHGSTSYTVVLALPGIDRIFLHNPGANDTFSEADISADDLKDAALFHFGYPPLMKKMYEAEGAGLESLFRGLKERNIATSLDMAAVDPHSEAGKADWGKILKRVLPYVDFFVPSFEELLFMLDREKYDALTTQHGDLIQCLDMEEDVKPLARRCLELGCRVALIKCGTKGLYCCTASAEKMAEVGDRLELDPETWGDREGIQPCFRADRVLSGTGAGDTSIAAFLMGVVEGRTPEWCAALAAAEGACAVTTYDALSGLKPLAELEERIVSGWETM